MPSSQTLPRTASLAVAFVLAACAGCSDTPSTGPVLPDVPTPEALVAAAVSEGMTRVTFPDPDPGIPLYARVTGNLNQFFNDGEWLAIPFYRVPELIPAPFNLLDYFDFPGPGGPGAFATPLTISGFFMIEADAPLGTFPKVVISSGTEVPIWFVRWSDWQGAAADGVVTMAELASLSPRKGIASRFQETLRPRGEEHLVIINASGQLEDGRRFELHVTHQLDQLRAIRIRFGR